jgi:hypothetical protein
MTAHTMDHDDLRHAAALLDQVEETLAHAHGRVPPCELDAPLASMLAVHRTLDAGLAEWAAQVH